MKFLCLACDEPMRLLSTRGPEDGSLTVIFACPTCGQRVAMLTNPWETQLVRSLGVRVGAPGAPPGPFESVRAALRHQREGAFVEARGPGGAPGGAEAAPDPAEVAPAGSPGQGPGCPFAAMLGAQEADRSRGALPWTPEAEARAERIPAFIRPWARQAIERFARERGYQTVTDAVLDEAREFMGM